MYPGNVAELPAGGEIRWHNGVSFHVYASAGTIAVFWQEKKLCCLLVGCSSRRNPPSCQSWRNEVMATKVLELSF